MADVLVKNLQETIAELKREVRLISREITSANLEKKKAIPERDKVFSEIRQAREEYGILQDDCEKIRGEIIGIEKSRAEFEERRIEAQKLFDSEKKEKMKELSRHNSWILAAKEEEERLGERLVFIKQKIESQKEKFEQVLSLENEIKELEIKKDSLEKENKSLILSRKSEIASLEKQVSMIIEHIEVLKLDAQYAQDRKQRIDNEAVLKIDDLKTYEMRIKKVWDKVFPDRNMPMLS